MEHWKREFLYQIKQGIPPERACRSAAGMSLKEVLDAREADPNFAYAWEAIAPIEDGDAKGAARILTPITLEALLWAQCDDKRAAAYFNLTPEEFLEKVSKDSGLKRVYDTAREAGLAALQMAQMDQAMSGDKTMLTFLGKNYLGQAEKTESKVVVENQLQDTRELARAVLHLFAENNLIASPIIDVVPKDVIELEPE